MKKFRPRLIDSDGCRCQRYSLRYGAVVPNCPGGASTQAFAFNTRSWVGSMQWQLGSFRSKGSPGTRLNNVVPPPQVAGLFSGPRPNCRSRLLFEAGTRSTSPL